MRKRVENVLNSEREGCLEKAKTLIQSIDFPDLPTLGSLLLAVDSYQVEEREVPPVLVLSRHRPRVAFGTQAYWAHRACFHQSLSSVYLLKTTEHRRLTVRRSARVFGQRGCVPTFTAWMTWQKWRTCALECVPVMLSGSRHAGILRLFEVAERRRDNEQIIDTLQERLGLTEL